MNIHKHQPQFAGELEFFYVFPCLNWPIDVHNIP